MSNALKKITARAKKIRKAHPSMTWKGAIKKAGADYRSGRISGTRKKRSPLKGRKHRHYGKVKSHRRRVNAITTASKTHTDYNKPEVNISIGGLKTIIKKKLNQSLDKKVIRKFRAHGKRQKRKIQKEITAVKAELRKLNFI